MTSDPAVLRLRPSGLEWREVDGEVLMLDLDSSEYFAVNAVGATLWPLLVKGATRDGLVSELVARYPSVGRDVLETDVDAFVGDLINRNLLLN